MTRKVAHSKKDITLIHNISVDDCIADEIEKLNNVHGIFTLSSCCGHGNTGYIIVAGSDMKVMIDLGYNSIALEISKIMHYEMSWHKIRRDEAEMGM